MLLEVRTTVYTLYFKSETPLHLSKTENLLSVPPASHLPFVRAPLRNISMTPRKSYFFMSEALKLPSCSLAWQLNHIFYDAAGDIVLFPHF